ncbi:MAG: hypothetical protein NC097_04665 [Clostridium sp.]|nr:hypothetical protein [Prevotella sp.]MCM1429070.1 hypothetical protein [Clostridium sp.]
MKRSFKILTTLILALLSALPAKGAMTGDWMIYPSFDRIVKRGVETPDRVYFAGYPREYSNTSDYFVDPYLTLFYFDKGSGEIFNLTSRDKLSRDYILDFAYNYAKKYLLIVYDDYTIDLLFDNGEVHSVGTLKSANIPGKKAVNDIAFSADHNAAYIATHFGYVCIDDTNFEITESRNYNTAIKSIARVDDRLVLTTPTSGYVAFVKSPRFTLEEYTPAPEIANACKVHGLNEDYAVAIIGERGKESPAKNVDFEPGGLKIKAISNAGNLVLTDYNVTPIGLTASCSNLIMNYGPNKKQKYTLLDASHANDITVSDDISDLYIITPRDGIAKYKVLSDVSIEQVTDYQRPNAPAANYSFNILEHPRYGMLVGSIGPEGFLKRNYSTKCYNLISGLKDGEWKEYAGDYISTTRLNNLGNMLGMAIDPDNSKYVYRGSFFHGIIRFNMEDPEDILILSRDNDNLKTDPGYVNIVGHLNIWSTLTRFYNPQFDNKGDLYSIYNYADTNPETLIAWRWPAENRRATVDAASFKPLENIIIPGVKSTNSMIFRVLRHSSNSTKFIIAALTPYDSSAIIIFDHKGTFSDPNDDTITIISSAYDQDGGSVDLDYINDIYEDPETGLVWLATNSGVFTVNVRQQNSTTGSFNRVKVARNDGTSLADYLLNEVTVNDIIDDGNGRKWFATAGGLVCTTSDGRRILGEFTTENSYLPSDNIFSMGYNSKNNSILMSTERGLAEFFPSGNSNASSEKSAIRAYPNPVEPDYYGLVTIDGLADNVLVKIADSNGGLVRELGRAESGSIQWDLQNLEHKRVATGVYFILVSPVDKNASGAAVGKILVLN